MDRSSSRSSDDIFSTPPEKPYPPRSRIYFPESSHPSRRRPYSAESSQKITQTSVSTRRTSSFSSPRALGQSRRHLSSSDGPILSHESSLRARRPHLFVPMEESLSHKAQDTPGPEATISDVFSDEYDLSHEDPRILQDVQRALRLKARREAKMKLQSSSDHHAHSKEQVSPNRQTFHSRTSPSPLRQVSASTGSDIDFSPSTRRPPAQNTQHPVPSSLDNGLTLDWGPSTVSEDKLDKRWSLPGRRKDKLPPLELMQDQQEKNHQERLSKLRASASSRTLRKVEITSSQLQRRYSLVEESVGKDSPSLNIAQVSRWHGSQTEAKQHSFEMAEPHTWLKHLPRKASRLSRWHLSALIIEQFIAAQPTPAQDSRHMEPIPEDDSLQPLSRTLTRESSLERVRESRDVNSQSPRISSDVDSRQSVESPLSSIISGPSNPVIIVSGSPNLIIPRPPSIDQATRLAVKAPSISDETDRGTEELPQTPAPMEPSPEKSNNNSYLSPGYGALPEGAANNSGIKLPKLILPDVGGQDTNNELDSRLSRSPGPRSRSWTSGDVHQRLNSSSVLRQLPTPPELRRDALKDLENEENLRKEYERKAVLLSDAMTHNQRIRQLLNRISISVKEYDAVQRTATNTLGKKYHALPKELIESFGHDPAAVTGSTKRLRGWRAVEDIHQRLIRQRQVLSAFISLESHRSSDFGSILDNEVTSLTQNLSILEEQKKSIVERVQEVEKALEEVQKTFKGVKTAYDMTVPLTSSIYPELSQAIDLEESYRNQYQQVWDFGMDALTLLLDTVTPFWRNYGKTIGEDVRDFLIVPLYRNQFTGEAKRYRINRFPSRSLNHWLGLALFFVSTMMLTALQARIAFVLTMHSMLTWIPIEGMRYTVMPFFWIGIFIQWCVVAVECGVVFMELGVIAWWMGWFVNLCS